MNNTLHAGGYLRMSCAELLAATGLALPQLDVLRPSWDSLPADPWLRDGGRYRYRRHSCYVQRLDRHPTTIALEPAPHRAHWQPTTYNALHGGIERWFEAVDPSVAAAAGWLKLIGTLGELFARERPVERWFVEAHQFRIDTRQGIGRPTPEGAHRDGVDFVALILVQRHNVRGGETRVFEAAGDTGVRFTMQQPWSALLLDDERVIHETTPIQSDAAPGTRDTLVLTYRAAGFLSQGATA